jgi:competence protein ComEC
LNVGQGDSQLLIFRDGMKLLIDGGPGRAVLDELNSVLPAADRYIDLVLMTHPQLDHMEGLVSVLKSYDVGAFLGTGRKTELGAYGELIKIIKEKNIPYIFLEEGDSIRYGDILMDVLSPSPELIGSPELNDGSLVLMINDSGIKSLFTGDIGENIETKLVKQSNLDADILKVGHHGSRFSSSKKFLAEVTPAVSIIEVGKNRYGHPTRETLERLASVGSRVFRTDLQNTIRLSLKNGEIGVASQK